MRTRHEVLHPSDFVHATLQHVFPPDSVIPPDKQKIMRDMLGYGAMAVNLSIYAMQAMVVLFVDDPLVLSILLAFVICRYEQAMFMGGGVLESVERELCPLNMNNRIGRILLPGYTHWDDDSHLINVGRLVATMACIVVKLCVIASIIAWRVWNVWKDTMSTIPMSNSNSGLMYGFGYFWLRTLRDKYIPVDEHTYVDAGSHR